MQTLKPFQVVVMVIFGLVALLGLFLFANFQGFAGGVKPLGPVTIWGTIPAGPIQKVLADMRQGHPELAQVTYVQRPGETFSADLAEAVASGRSPDLLLISQEELLSMQNKISLIPSSTISERTFRDTYLPIDELFLAPGGTYGIPFTVDPFMMYYSRPVLADAGVAIAPSTWEAVTGLASSLNKESQGQSLTKSLIALGTYENVENARAALSLLFLQSGYSLTARTANGMRTTLNDPSKDVYGSSPAESALNFYTEFANPGKTVYSWNRSLPNSRQAFLAGDLALYLGFASERAELAEANPNLDFDMAAVPVPSTATLRVTYGRAYAFAIPKSSPNGNGAYRAAMSLTSKDTLPGLAHGLGMAPAQRALLAPVKDDIYEPVYFPQALIAKGWLSPAPAITDRILGTMVGNVISGSQTVREALSSADQSLNASLK